MKTSGWPRRKAVLGLAVAFALGLAPVGALAQQYGGDLVVAISNQTATLDSASTGSHGTRIIGLNVFEMLVAVDEGVNPVPDLADSYSVSDDGLSYTFALRQGVKFHNGKTMTSEDVKASFERWARVGTDSAVMANVSSIDTPDANTVVVNLSTPVPTFIEQIASPRAAFTILPSEQADRGAGEIDLIGTGPFKVDEFIPGTLARLSRFDDYATNENYTGVDGFAGGKIAYVDTVEFRIVSDPGARVAALEAGEAHIVDEVPATSVGGLESNPATEVGEIVPWAMLGLMMNAGGGDWASNKTFRQAVRAAINPELVATASTGGAYRMNHAWIYPESDYYTGDIGRAEYDSYDVDRAKALLEEAGYDGSEVIVVGISGNRVMRDLAIVVVSMLQEAGINATLELSDSTAATSRVRGETEGWDIFAAQFGLAPWLGPYGLPNWWVGDSSILHNDDPVLESELAELRLGATAEDRKAAARRFYTHLFEEAYAVKIGDVNQAVANSVNVEGFVPFRIVRAWGVWFE